MDRPHVAGSPPRERPPPTGQPGPTLAGAQRSVRGAPFPTSAPRRPSRVGPVWRARAPALRAARDASSGVGSGPRDRAHRRSREPAAFRSSTANRATTPTGSSIPNRPSTPTASSTPNRSTTPTASSTPNRLPAHCGAPAGARAPSPAELDRRRAAPCQNAGFRRTAGSAPSRVRRAAERRPVRFAHPALDCRFARARQRRSGLAGEGARAPGGARRLVRRRFGA
jgi:hypothetical protein